MVGEEFGREVLWQSVVGMCCGEVLQKSFVGESVLEKGCREIFYRSAEERCCREVLEKSFVEKCWARVLQRREFVLHLC